MLHRAYEDLPDPKIAVVHDNREIAAAETLFSNVFYSSNPNEIFRLYSRCGYYVGARIHGFVPAVLHGAAAHLIYPTDKALVAKTLVTRLRLKGSAKVEIMKKKPCTADLTLVPSFSDHISMKLAKERERYRKLFSEAPHLQKFLR